MKRETEIISNLTIVEVVTWGIVGVLVRTAYVVWVVGRYGKDQFSDFLYLHQLAESVASDKGFTIEGVRIFNQSVGYPTFLGFFYKIFGSDIWTALVVNIVLGGLSVALVYILSLKLFARMEQEQAKIMARCTVLLAIIYPDSLLYCAFVSAENLLIPIMLLLVISVITDWRNDWLSGIITGFAAAAACSVKAHVLFFCLTIPLIWYFINKRFLVRVSAAGLMAVICLMPWTVLNYRASGGYILPFTAVAGEVMLDGTNPNARGKPTNQYHLSEDMEKGKHPIELDRLRMKQAMKYISQNPLWYCKLCVRKAVYAFSPMRDFLFEFHEQKRFFNAFFSRWVITGFNLFVLIGTVLGVWIVRGDSAGLATGLALFIVVLLIQVLFFAYSRYRFPFLFCLLPYCAFGTAFASLRITRAKGCE